MPIRAVYVRLSSYEFKLLQEMAEEDRRGLPDQAAHLVSVALHHWKTNKLFEQSLDAPDDVVSV